LRLSDLRGDGAAPLSLAGGAGGDVEITGLCADSRAVRPGDLFAALSGGRADGRRFVGDAVARGAVAVLGDASLLEGGEPPPVPVLVAEDPRRALALAAARFFGRQPRRVAAVTGTSGKTSTASFARQLWAALGRKAASVGTLGVEAPGRAPTAALTTPDPVELHRTLAELADGGVDHLCLEASSHGLDQRRLDGVRLAAGAFTNLARDHYDYHGGPEAYLAAKRRLFEALLPAGAVAVLNADVPEFRGLAGVARRRGLGLLDYGRGAAALRLLSVAPAAHGQRLEIEALGRRHAFDSRLVGAFQAHNLLAALGLVVACGERVEEVLPHLAGLEAPPGRMQLAATHPSGAPAFVDYAHKPEALEKALETLRPHATGRLVVVVGCGGDRDAGKRPIMGAIAARLADRVVVTDDNPRTEDPAAIRRAVLAGAPGAVEIGDREAAIRAAFAGLEAGDALLVAGKGHETYQIVGDRTLPFDDAEVLRRCAREAAGGGSVA
jgi:UDP-N-acetylmuramoyl-L-alanyl-D-glutamate--2,6-diaminopimelate ligase